MASCSTILSNHVPAQVVLKSFLSASCSCDRSFVVPHRNPRFQSACTNGGHVVLSRDRGGGKRENRSSSVMDRDRTIFFCSDTVSWNRTIPTTRTESPEYWTRYALHDCSNHVLFCPFSIWCDFYRQSFISDITFFDVKTSDVYLFHVFPDVHLYRYLYVVDFFFLWHVE